ncbi:hypothetical protein [Siphonobacter aquaeclarae]|uniref:Uncharacterized protein n=1 Tax=Siphonobacter aquaeclarae TaxID=563176 RepID=A0A1G9PE59_9BACT|nr:hypothetical protein [Siphonobacter aquaeclarae]SDL97152.1 hypothetical protein SAMN04488090_2146 [Siphonobacter aquaeclarae]
MHFFPSLLLLAVLTTTAVFSQTPLPNVRTDTINVFPAQRALKGVWEWSKGNEKLTFYIDTDVVTHAGNIRVEHLFGNHVYERDGKRIDPLRGVSDKPTGKDFTIIMGPSRPEPDTRMYSGSVREESLGKSSEMTIDYDPILKIMKVQLSDQRGIFLSKPIEGHVLPVSFELKKIK